MNEKQINLVKSILGDDIFEVLEKTEIHKLNTNTSLDPEEIKLALQIVPRSILSYLFAHLKHRATGDIIDLELPFANAQLHVNKQGPDNYRGEIYQDGKKVLEFLHRSLPSIGLLILTTFELYDMSLLDEVKKDVKESDKQEKLQDIIDERLNLNRLICDVVDKRISEREAIDKLIRNKLHEHIVTVSHMKEEAPMEQESKKNKLKLFLESRERRREESVELDKSEVKCPDCDTALYKGGDNIKLCICYGQYHNKDIKFKKSENGKVELKFPKSFDIDNIEMLLDALKNK